MLTAALDDVSGSTGIATDQLALSVQEIPSNNAMEMGQIMRTVGRESMLLKLMAVNEKEKR